MKRETRANWWFIVIFLLVSLPGAVILFIKKLDPSSARFDQPEEMLTSLPYMAPLPVPIGTKWIVPPRTLAWLRRLAKSHGASEVVSAVPPGPEWEPVISSDHVLQLMIIKQQPNYEGYALLIWDGSLPLEPAAYQATTEMPDRTVGGHVHLDVSNIESIFVPEDVRRELIGLGFVKPPARVVWIEVGRGYIFVPVKTITINCATALRPLHSSVYWPYLGLYATTLPDHDPLRPPNN